MLYLIILIVLAWNIAPLLYVLSRKEVPLKHRLLCCGSLMWASIKGAVALVPDLLAPFVVPFALLMTKREDNHLPKWFRPWDNDVSINGDVPAYWEPNYEGDTYYANAHPRSFWARYVWLGWRNRASWTSQRLGYLWKEGDQDQRESWGDSKTGRDHAGWTINVAAGVYQLYRVQYLGELFGHPLCLRTNFGHKVWAGYDQRERANVVTIAASVLNWTGEKP